MLWQAAGITAAVILVCIAWVFLTNALSRLLPRSKRRTREDLSWRVQVALAWTGTRGAVALALPLTYADGRPFDNRDLLIVLTVSVVLLTLLLQGLTLGPLLRRFRATAHDEEEREALERTRASAAAVEAALRTLELLRYEEDVPVALAERLSEDLQARLERADPAAPAAEETRLASSSQTTKQRRPRRGPPPLLTSGPVN